jgi:hypothetical protein
MTGAVLGVDDASRYFSRCSAGIRDRSYAKSVQLRNGSGIYLDYLVDVHHGLPLVVALQMEVAHSHLSKVTGMVPVQVGSVVVLSTSQTALGRDVSVMRLLSSLFSFTYTSGMLAVLAHAAVSGADMASVFPGLAQVSRHVESWCRVGVGVEDKTSSRCGEGCKRAYLYWTTSADRLSFKPAINPPAHAQYPPTRARPLPSPLDSLCPKHRHP